MQSTQPYAYLLLLALLCAQPVFLAAQHGVDGGFLQKVPTTTLPQQDNARLLEKELAARAPGRPITFAVAIPTRIRPTDSGIWAEAGGNSNWYLRVRSEGAQSLNLGFSEYHLPEGAALYLSTEAERFGPFTVADNKDHDEFWTPMLDGEELLIELEVPTAKKKDVRLYLTSVNHDFVGMTKSASGGCNLDVICGADDGWEIVDGYRDIIRSVGVYSLAGTRACTGFLVNNVNQDGTPFFMTANHCNVSEDNDQSMVVYWNFENLTCRQPDTAFAGSGSGRLDVFQRGARLLANNPPTDMALTVLEDPVVPAANAFFAGWSRDPVLPPTDTVIAIHHPRVNEKRISFSFETVDRSFTDTSPDPEGTFLTVTSWSIGTTEGGSSGSPLFDSNRRVRGQLFGGTAGCQTPDGYDIYGFFHSSWTGGGDRSSSLNSWLDPCGAAGMELDGLEASVVPNLLAAEFYCREVCTGDTLSYAINIGSGYPTGADLRLLDVPAGITATLSTNTAGGGDRVSVEVIVPPDLAIGSYPFRVRITGGGQTDEITLTTFVLEGSPAAPVLLSPSPGDTDAQPLLSFAWEATAIDRAYDFELATDAAFTQIIQVGASLRDPALELGFVLDGDTDYFWRVRARNACGIGPWSVGTFKTADRTCEIKNSSQTPVSIGPGAGTITRATVTFDDDVAIQLLSINVRIQHTFIGDLSADLVRGTDTLRLFDAPLNGSCGAPNMDVVFSSEASASADDFVATCFVADPGSQGTFQPAGSFDRYVGTSARGDWTLIVTDDENGDGGSLTDFEITVCGKDNTTSVHELGTSGSLSIFPNPASERVTIDLKGDWPAQVNGRLYDLTGRPLRDYRLAGGGTTTWDVSRLPTGMYFLRIRSGGKEFTERLVVTR